MRVEAAARSCRARRRSPSVSTRALAAAVRRHEPIRPPATEGRRSSGAAGTARPRARAAAPPSSRRCTRPSTAAARLRPRKGRGRSREERCQRIALDRRELECRARRAPAGGAPADAARSRPPSTCGCASSQAIASAAACRALARQPAARTPPACRRPRPAAGGRTARDAGSCATRRRLLAAPVLPRQPAAGERAEGE